MHFQCKKTSSKPQNITKLHNFPPSFPPSRYMADRFSQLFWVSARTIFILCEESRRNVNNWLSQNQCWDSPRINLYNRSFQLTVFQWKTLLEEETVIVELGDSYSGKSERKNGERRFSEKIVRSLSLGRNQEGYSNHLNTGLVRYLNGQSKSGLQKVNF